MPTEQLSSPNAPVMTLDTWRAIFDLWKTAKNADKDTVPTNGKPDLVFIDDLPSSFTEPTTADESRLAEFESASQTFATGIVRRPLMSFQRDLDNSNTLIKGRWGVRGTVSMHISTTGTGKSVLQTQSALSFAAGIPCCGLTPTRPLRTWIVQSEDDEDRVAWDRDDILSYLRETHPDVDWDAAAASVTFLDYTGRTGADFLETLDIDLYTDTPDCLIINPMNAYFGGSLKEGADCSAFFKGGKLNGEHTQGLEAILKKHKVWGWIFAHTGKPPSSSELKDWLKDPFSAYKMCGASEIADSVRSIITFLKVPGTDGVFSFSSGKNGNGLGWTDPNGLPTTYSFSRWGSDGRHYWEEVPADEWPEGYADVRKRAPEADVMALVNWLEHHVASSTEINNAKGSMKGISLSRTRVRAAFAEIVSSDDHYGLSCKSVTIGGHETKWWGVEPNLSESLNMEI